jgi:ankyrin repeat protein
MPRPVRSFDRMIIPAPCEADWDSMAGNDQVRFCEHCNLQVNNLSNMTRQKAMRLVARSEGRLCVRYIRTSDGAVLTKDGSEKLHRIARRVSRIAAGAFTATLSLSSAVTQTRTALPETRTTAALAFGMESPSLSGVVTDLNGAVVPGASVTLFNKQTNLLFVYVTGDDGAYRFSVPATGAYTLLAEALSFAGSELLELDLRSDLSRTMDLTLGIPEVMEEVEIKMVSREVVVQGGVGIREPEEPFVKAAFKNDLNALVELIPVALDINVNDKFTDTNALAYAVENHNRDMVNVLISAGANVNSENRLRRTPLMHLDAEATVELVRDLISAGANVNASDESGRTVLMNAATSCSLEVIKALIDAGAKVDARDNQGDTLLTRAAENQDAEVVKFFIKAGLSLDRRNDNGESALMIAARTERVGNLRALIHAGATTNLSQSDLNEVLISAASSDDSSVIKLLLDAGASPNAKDDDGKTALMEAAEYGPSSSLKILIDAGAELNVVNDEGWTALMFASEVEHVGVLLDAGADLTIKNKEGETVLDMALKYEQADIAALLKARGARK